MSQSKYFIRIFLAIMAICFWPGFSALGYEFCPKNIAPKPGKYVIAKFSSSELAQGARPECLTFGSTGDVIVVKYQENMKTAYGNLPVDKVMTFMSGKGVPCSAEVEYSSSKYYVLKCPGSKNGNFYFDFNGQRSSEFNMASGIKISKDGKIFSADVSVFEGGNRSVAKTIFLGAIKKEVPQAHFDSSFKESARVEMNGRDQGSQAIVYYNNQKIAQYQGYYDVSIRGIIKGKGPLYSTERYLPNLEKEYAVYLGKQQIYLGSDSIYHILISPGERNYAIDFHNGKNGVRDIIYNGKSIPNTGGAISSENAFGFSDNDKFYYASAENGKTYFNFNGRKVEVPSKYYWDLEIKGNNYLLSYANVDSFSKGIAGLIYNGRKIVEKNTTNGLRINPGYLSDDGKRYTYFIEKQYHNNNNDEGEGSYLNGNKIEMCRYGLMWVSKKGNAYCDYQKIRGGQVFGVIKNGKLLISYGEGEIAFVNDEAVVKRKMKVLNASPAAYNFDVSYSYNGKVIGEVKNLGVNSNLYEILSDDGKYLSVAYVQGNNLVKEVIAVK